MASRSSARRCSAVCPGALAEAVAQLDVLLQVGSGTAGQPADGVTPGPDRREFLTWLMRLSSSCNAFTSTAVSL